MVSMKTTGHEKMNITVGLMVAFSGVKNKPFVVFKGKGKTVEAKELAKIRDVFVTWSDNGWFNDDLTSELIEKNFGFHFGNTLLIWDAYRCHKSFKVCGQTSDVTHEDISCFKEGKASHDGLEKLKELWAVDQDNIDYGAMREITDFDTLEYIPEEMPEEEEPDLEQEEENELVVHLEEDEDLEEEAEEPVGGLFGTKRKRVDNNNSVCKRKK